MADPIDEFAQTIAGALEKGSFSDCELRTLRAQMVGDLTFRFGEASLRPRIRATSECESVKLSTGLGEARIVGRAAPSDCKTQP